MQHMQELQKGIQARVICDSIIAGQRLTTFELRFPRFILPELNTHRVFSRNSASSRARSITKSFAEVMQDPFVPNPFTKNKKGMSGAEIDPSQQAACEKAWLASRDMAMLCALDLLVGEEKRQDLIGNNAHEFARITESYNMETDEPSVHKQHVNRLLEPFMWHTTVLSSTEWDNFFELRIAPDAQPEIYELAWKMKAAYDASSAEQRRFHLPYITYQEGTDELAFSIKHSVACCATVSYKAPEELKNLEVASRIFDSMAQEKHLSPFEHVAFEPAALEEFCTALGWDLSKLDMSAIKELNSPLWSGNFRPGLIQLRKVLEKLSD